MEIVATTRAVSTNDARIHAQSATLAEVVPTAEPNNTGLPVFVLMDGVETLKFSATNVSILKLTLWLARRYSPR